MNVFILIGLIMTIAGIFLIMVSACILLALWGINAAEEYKHKRENGDE